MKNTACLGLSGLILCILTACSGSHDNAGPQPASAVAASKPGSLSDTKTLKIFNWSDYVDPKTIGEFEKNMALKSLTIFMTVTKHWKAKF